MSIDNSQVVRSKYFAGKPAMDESLSDFQESKQSCKGPKAVQKTSKPKPRKANKRIKGQKDIRTALKGKKNELISYTKEFDNVCKKSGLDVDSEQLQLAIALSKSLHRETTDDASTSQVLTTQGRIAKIKTTLKEYGFKVPETKIAIPNKRKEKQKLRYKLITTAEEEKHQRISSKYSQVLFQNLDCSTSNDSFCNEEHDTPIYNIGTCLKYEHMRDNSIFYVDNLVEKSCTTGSLLRDWSTIPGRPVSPILFDTISMDFSEILCSQEELDIILSGSLKSAKQIVVSKEIEKPKAHTDNAPQDVSNQKTEQISSGEMKDVHSNVSIIIEEANQVTKLTAYDRPDKEIENMDTERLDIGDSTTIRDEYRSCSPDIFDDEVSCIMDTSKPVLLSQGQKTKLFTNQTNAMDLTECANNIITQNMEKKHFMSNITKRKSNDFMEITECAVSASQGIREDEKEIDLTQSPGKESTVIYTEKNRKTEEFKYVAESPDCSILDNDEVLIAGKFDNDDLHETHQDSVDLTQKSTGDLSVDLEENNQVDTNKDSAQITVDKNNEIVLGDEIDIAHCYSSPKDGIDLTQSSNEDENKQIIEEEDSLKDKKAIDLTQSSKSSVDIDDLPEVNIGNIQTNQSDLDNTIIINEDEYKDTFGKIKKSIIVQDEQVYDLTQSMCENFEQPNNVSKESNSKLCSQSFYDDFEYDHSDNKENVDDVEISEDKNISNISKESNDIDLTQSSDGSATHSMSPRPVTVFENAPNNSNLGKRDEISIDYDEICEYNSTKGSNCNETDKDSLKLKYDSSKSVISNNLESIDNNIDLVLSSSQNSEVFDLTDRELDYSLHKSRHDVPDDNYNFDFGGISVMDDVSGVRTVRDSLGPRPSNNYTLGESFLPEVNVRKVEEKCVNDVDSNIIKPKAQSPAKMDGIQITVPVVTPKNSEYIVKTNNVTPMVDYASMTTPQRNKELDKYGLKPFKRKRAIQILTHLYNQTHPMMEPETEEGQPTPSKKPRRDTNTSPKPLLNFNNDAQIHKNIPSPLKESGAVRNFMSPRKFYGRNKNKNSPRKEGNSSKDIDNDYVITTEVPRIKDVECHPDDWVFQKREKAKVHSCRVPLHIAFHNYVSSRQALREAILKYEPVNIDVIHKDLVSYGYRYDPKDLLRFLDKKCITVKTTDNNARNKR